MVESKLNISYCVHSTDSYKLIAVYKHFSDSQNHLSAAATNQGNFQSTLVIKLLQYAYFSFISL